MSFINKIIFILNILHIPGYVFAQGTGTIPPDENTGEIKVWKSYSAEDEFKKNEDLFFEQYFIRKKLCPENNLLRFSFFEKKTLQNLYTKLITQDIKTKTDKACISKQMQTFEVPLINESVRCIFSDSKLNELTQQLINSTALKTIYPKCDESIKSFFTNILEKSKGYEHKK